jgi:hypothetical protein
MISFFARGLKQPLAHRIRSRGEGLAYVERLSGDLAGMINAHEGGRAALLREGEPGLLVIGCRRGPIGARRRGESSQRLVDNGNEAVGP